jgi:glutamine---fructose-6-phosphate transaminase (isomerizing)
VPIPEHYRDIFPEWRDGPPYVMEDMVEAQPAMAAGILEQRSIADEIAREVQSALAAGAPIAVTGCGTSEHGAQGLAELLDEAIVARGGPSGRIEMRQAFDAGLLVRPGGLLITVSSGGHSKASSSAMAAARGAGARNVLITEFRASPCRDLADVVMTTEPIDASYCHSVGYTAPMIAGASIAAAHAGWELDAGAVAAHLTDLLGVRGAVRAAAERFRRAERVLTAGSGADRGAARELALKLAEGAWIPSAMLDLENVMHGHLVAHDDRSTLVLVATDGTSAGSRAERAAQILRATRHIGLETVAIVDERMLPAIGADTAGATVAVPCAPELPGSLGALLASAVALQLLTLEVAVVRGTNPDTLRREQPPYFEAVAIGDAKLPRVAQPS